MITTVLAAGNDNLTGWDVAGFVAWCWLITRN